MGRRYINLGFCCLFPIFILSSCTGAQKLAPVERAKMKSAYTVQSGDTLYSIAWRYGIDYKDLVKLNHLSSPYPLHRGQQLRMVGNLKKSSYQSSRRKVGQKQKQASKREVLTRNTRHKEVLTRNTRHKKAKLYWQWPVKGKIVKKFTKNNKGIDITGSYRTPIYASAYGDVVYAGTGIPGYGKLIIIKHNATYLSAYAYNDRLFVRQGSSVKRGQKIAEMGRNRAHQVRLHFEIRRDGKPINPLSLL